jgi:hypothetical protein
MIVPITCQECLESMNRQHQNDLDRVRKEVIEQVIKLFKKDSIYTGAVIEFEIKNNLVQKGCGKLLTPRYLGFTCGERNPFSNSKPMLCDECEKQGEQHD